MVQAAFDTLCWAPDEVLVLCLGLGSPLESKSAVHQLVFISSICETLNIVGLDTSVSSTVVNFFSSLPTEWNSLTHISLKKTSRVYLPRVLMS